MKRKMLLLALCFMCLGMAACGAGSEAGESSSAAQTDAVAEGELTAQAQSDEESEEAEEAQSEGDTQEASEAEEAEEKAETQHVQAEDPPAETQASQDAETSQDTQDTQSAAQEPAADALTEDQALGAIKNYCFTKDPGLQEKVDSGEYNIYWSASTNDNGEIVVLYRSYTAAELRYYIDPVSGETYVTELVPGIIDEEQRTEDSLNAWDYVK